MVEADICQGDLDPDQKVASLYLLREKKKVLLQRKSRIFKLFHERLNGVLFFEDIASITVK